GNMEALSILALGAYANETLNPAAKGRYSEPRWRKHRSEERLHGRAIILVALSLNAVRGKPAAPNHPVAHAVNRDDARRCARRGFGAAKRGRIRASGFARRARSVEDEDEPRSLARRRIGGEGAQRRAARPCRSMQSGDDGGRIHAGSG